MSNIIIIYQSMALLCCFIAIVKLNLSIKEYKEKIKNLIFENSRLFTGKIFASTCSSGRVLFAEKRMKAKEEEANEWKKKYLDEQHKRLELAEIVERLEREKNESEGLSESIKET